MQIQDDIWRTKTTSTMYVVVYTTVVYYTTPDDLSKVDPKIVSMPRW